jgi:DNA-binding transcriptional LysR family regulator
LNSGAGANLRELRAFVEVYRWRKLSAAAERLFLTPSAVSVLLRQLEASVGVRLFDRTTRALSPTEAAQQMLPIAERILRDVRTLESGFRTPIVPSGRVAVAVTPTVALTLMPPLIKHFNDLHPHIHVQLVDGETDQFVPRILSEQVDFGVGAPGQALGDLTQLTLIEDHLSMACLPEHPLARLRHLRWADLAGHPLVTVKPGYGIRGAIDDTARRARVTLDIRHEVSMLTTALAMAAHGLGVAIVPAELVLLSGFTNLVVRKIGKPVVVRNISVVMRRHRTLSAAAQTFVALMQAQLARPRA